MKECDIGSKQGDEGQGCHTHCSQLRQLALLQECGLKKCISLSCWIESVKNKIWYALGSCNGNAELLIEMDLAIPQHVAGIHLF